MAVNRVGFVLPPEQEVVSDPPFIEAGFCVAAGAGVPPMSCSTCCRIVSRSALGGARFQIQAQHRLGIVRTDVAPPVGKKRSVKLSRWLSSAPGKPAMSRARQASRSWTSKLTRRWRGGAGVGTHQLAERTAAGRQHPQNVQHRELLALSVKTRRGSRSGRTARRQRSRRCGACLFDEAVVDAVLQRVPPSRRISGTAHELHQVIDDRAARRLLQKAPPAAPSPIPGTSRRAHRRTSPGRHAVKRRPEARPVRTAACRSRITLAGV